MSRHVEHKNIWGRFWKSKGRHTLVVNGFDRDALRIYDPWSEIYYIRLKRERVRIRTFGIGQERSVVEYARGNSAESTFVSINQKKGMKIILDEYIGWSFIRFNFP